jgi:hypothetical protein
MRKYLVSVVLIIALFACKDDKTSGDDKQTEASGFYAAYGKLKLPFSVTDTSIIDVADTSTISYPIFTQFIPDTIFNHPFGKDRKLTIHPVGKIEQKGKETYLVTLVKSKSRSAIYLSVIDKDKFTTSMPLAISNEDEIVHSAAIDKKLTIVINDEWTIKNDIYYERTIYAYNNVGIFTVVLTETNKERNTETAILNPLDTFPKKYKYSGDYANGSKKVLFIRDGQRPDEYRFFVHFTNENQDDPCGGELKGQFKMVSDKAGVYNGNGDPCVLDLSFSGNEVRVKETGSCGNYRGIRCFFNDTYTKKKEPKTSAKKKV